MTAYRLNVEDVRALLRPEQVITACGIDAVSRRRAWRLRTCPACKEKPRRQGAAIYRRKRDDAWRWTHHGHACGGDMLDIIAVTEGIDRGAQLPKLLERAAQLAGITPSDPDLERRISGQIAADRARREVEDAERTAALAAMPATWEQLSRRSLIGERYLQNERRIDPAALRERGDVVRFTASGELALPMRDLESGAIVGIQYRAPGAKAFRTEPWSDAESSALVGRPTDIDPGGLDVAVLVEGLADTLAACLAFPTCAIYGAAGAAHMETIAAALAPKLLAARGWLLLTVDGDEPGIEAAADAITAATDAGLVVDRDLHVVDLGDHHDLADAYAAGWRWTWPDTRSAP